MRFATHRLVAVVLATAACQASMSASQRRAERVTAATSEASRLPGPRQAQELAIAVNQAALAGDYANDQARLDGDAGRAIAALDRAVEHAGVDAPRLVAWRALMLIHLGQGPDALRELERSFAMAPNPLAGQHLILIYGGLGQPDRVGATCVATVDVLTDADERLEIIASCRASMNAASVEGELAWMTPEQRTWYQDENARRMEAAIDAANQQREQDRRDQRVVRWMEQCAATCKESGLRCQNRCDGDAACDERCVGINRACLDRCEAQAYDALGIDPETGQRL